MVTVAFGSPFWIDVIRYIYVLTIEIEARRGKIEDLLNPIHMRLVSDNMLRDQAKHYMFSVVYKMDHIFF